MRRPAELVFVTGAGSGIGRATARHFARKGATVIVTDINPVTAAETVELVRGEDGVAHGYVLDVADAAAFETLAEKVRHEHGVPDLVVNNAGMVIFGGFLEHSTEDWERTVSTHLMGVVHGSRLFGAQMTQTGRGGHIVNLSSVAGFVPSQFAPAYCTAKAGIRMLSECLSIELAHHGIGVTAICPGLIATNIAQDGQMLKLDDATVNRAQAAARRGMRLGSSPETVARAIERSVRHNRTVVPLRPEAWLGQAMMRLSPEAGMTLMGFGTRDNLLRLVRVFSKGAA